MSAVMHPRGPLPPRVYWIRRGVVLALALLLVIGIARLLGGGSNAADQAGLAAANPSPSQAPVEVTTSATGQSQPGQNSTPKTKSGPGKNKSKRPTPQPTLTSMALPQPTGACDPADLAVNPVAVKPYAGHPIAFQVEITSTTVAACTFAVSPDSLILKVTSGSDFIWSTQDCPAALTKRQVVVRQAGTSAVEQAALARAMVTWSSRRSDSDCSRNTDWAQPGWYHAVAAVLGGTPTDRQFQLTIAPQATITKTVSPSPTGPVLPGTPGSSPTPRPNVSAPSPSGAVEPDELSR